MVYTCMIGLVLLWPHLTAAKTTDSVRFQHSRLTVNVKNTSLESVLRKVAEQAGISVIIYGRLDRSVTYHFKDLPLEKGIKKLLARTNTSFLYKTETASSGHKLNVLEKVFIFGGGSSAVTTRLGFQEESVKVRRPKTSGITKSGSPEGRQVTRTYFSRSKAPVYQPEAGKSEEYHEITIAKAERERLKSVPRGEFASQIQAVSTIKNKKIKSEDTAQDSPFQDDGDHSEKTALEITSIIQDSIFTRMGLRSGDIIQNVNGSPVADTEQLTKEIINVVAGPGSDMIRIEIERDGKVEPIYVMME